MAKTEMTKTAQALHRLRAFYETGQESREDHAGRMPAGEIWDQAGKRGMNRETYGKSRSVADRYEPAEIRQLVKQCREHGFAMGPNHLIRLSSIHDKRKRAKLQEAAIRGHWSVRRLNSEIFRSCGKQRTYGGRACKVQSISDVRYRLMRFSDSWERFYLAVYGPAECHLDEHPKVWHRLPPPVQQQLQVVCNALAKLDHLTQDHL